MGFSLCSHQRMYSVVRNGKFSNLVSRRLQIFWSAPGGSAGPMRWTRIVRPPHLLLISSYVLFFSSVGLCRVASSLSRACFLSITVLFVLFCAWLLLSPEPLGLIWNGRDHVTKRSEGLWEWPEETRVQGLEKVWWNLWCTFYDARALSDHSRITRHKVTCIEPSKKKNPCRKRERPVTERRT